MNKISRCFFFFLLSLFTLLITGCNKDNDEPDEPVPPRDEYVGIHKILTYLQEMRELQEGEFVCYLRTDKGEIISRVADHSRRQQVSTLLLRDGLKEGVYEFLRMEYESKKEDATIRMMSVGFGAQLQVTAEGITNRRDYDPSVGFFGAGTKESPYIISADNHLLKLAKLVNDTNDERYLLKEGSFFRQTDDIDMDDISYESDHKYGWRPIGLEPGLPFVGSYDGGGYSITGLYTTRPNTTGVGLFGYVCQSYLQNIVIEGASIGGNSSVAALAGNVVTYGNERARTIIRNCRVEQSRVVSEKGGVGIGGLLGTIDGRALVFIDSCSVDQESTIEGDTGIGGLVGMGLTFSSMFISNSDNHASIHADNTGAGGIIGLADTLLVVTCDNYGLIRGAISPKGEHERYGAGGIAGGSGNAVYAGCSNLGSIQGERGVGGILGSTLVNVDECIYNSIAMQSCHNNGEVKATQYAGGICGEAQGMISDCFNQQTVQVTSGYVGGIIGYLPGGTIYDVSNFGTIVSTGKCGGISGKTDVGIIGIANNFGEIQANGECVGGILGMGGSSSMVHYCSNFASVKNPGGKNTAGLVGMIGDMREWTDEDIANIVMGAIDIVGGAISFATIGLEALEGGLKLGLGIAGIVTAGTIWIGDATLFTLGFLLEDYGLSEEAHLWSDAIQAKLMAKAHLLDSQYDQAIHEAMGKWNIKLDTNFNKAVIADHFKANIFQLKSFYTNQANEGANSILFNKNVNQARDDRGLLVVKEKDDRSLAHTIISGICIGLALVVTVASIVATVVSAGTLTAVAIGVTGGLIAIVGGANTIHGVCTDFAENVCVVDQCMNAGDITGGDNTAGLVGTLEQNCRIANCINIGNGNGNSPAFAHIHSNTEVENCLNAGMSWKKVVDTTGEYETVTNCYSLKNNNESLGRCTPLESGFNKASTYHGWSINEKESPWHIPESTEGAFPIPYYSQMQKEK
ncbi:hypothetical protein M2480_001761 [Parabacteroides sp. PFB2-12]|uniref:hypothetical protein n=1 Tax=unclassified Parabacteroides TaxID=2649774 RepID=UPI0024731D3A|nr:MULTISPECIES: hypothetical protein [unclassified Parabacteroides]MDH6343135.1 hypothetical protein [Parabacteroides sp. PM6-13]MDH6390779.1 hypothetical protein [Parabacteroides sp. PFB2-12]